VEKYLKVLEELAGQKLQRSYDEIARTGPSSLKLEKNSFRKAVLKAYEDGKGSPMYETYVNYALTTNERGDALAHFLSPYVQFRDRSYLDIGTAYGGYLVAFAKRGCRPYLGIEINERLIELCKLNLMENKVNPDHVLQQDICEPLPANLKERKFDLITCTDVLEHVLDLPRTLENLKTLLADRGHLYLEIPNRYHIKNVISDPHFGLFGITLFEKEDAITYFRYLRAGDYLVADYHDLDGYISFFPEADFVTQTLSTESINLIELNTLFKKEIENSFESKVENLPVPEEMKEKLKEKFKQYIARYVEQMQQKDLERFYLQNWKMLIQKK
jgi:2-polyprenyl-3-methyl-5-hydroxy-6-metoxy-1,4-benzoquinol methylase